MSGNRHFAIFEGNGEEVIILGYRQKTNDVLICFPSALSQQEGQALRLVVQSETAQKKDYLMDQVSGSVLGAAHHPSAGVDWQTYLIRQAATGRSQAVRKVTMKELNFQDASQKAFFGGYGPSIEPEVDAARKQRINAQDAMMNGQPLPEPPMPAPAPAVEAAPAAPAEDTNSALVAALAGIAQTNAAILEKLDKMDKPARKPASRRKTPAKRKTAAKKEEPAPAPVVEEDTLPSSVAPGDDFSMTSSAYGGNEE